MKFSNYYKNNKLRDLFQTKFSDKFTIGTDGITTNKFNEILDEEIIIIKRKIQNLTYNVSTYKEKLILKDRNSNPRMISIPTNRDRLIFSALTSYISDCFKDKLYSNNIHTKILDIKTVIEEQKYDSFIKIDIENFYPSIDHKILMKKVSKKINDEAALNLLNKAITKYTISTKNKYIELETKGIPQGLSFSNILSSIYFQKFDKKYTSNSNILYHRFVDDILILCNKNEIKSIKKSILKNIKKLKLTIHNFKKNSSKSAVGNIETNNFEYLGYLFNNKNISVRNNSVDKLRDSIIDVFRRSNTQKELYRKLNLKITGCLYDGKRYGWLSFFSLSNDITLLYSLDSFIEKCFKRFHIIFDDIKIKKFSKSFYAWKNIESTSYIPKYNSLRNEPVDIWVLKEIQKNEKEIEFY